MLTVAPRAAVVVGLVETAALRAHPSYARIVASFADAQVVQDLTAACGPDPLEPVRSLGFWREANGSVGVSLRGPVASPERAACAEQLAGLLMPTSRPLNFARGRELVLASAGAPDVLQALLDGRGPNAGSNPRHAALARFSEGAHLRVTFDLAEGSLDERARFLTELGDAEDHARQSAPSVRGGSLGGVLDEDRGLALSGHLALADRAVARELSPRMRERAQRLVGEVRESIDAAEREMGSPAIWSPAEFANARRLLERFDGLQNEVEDSGLALQWVLAADGVRDVTDTVALAFTRYRDHLERVLAVLAVGEIVRGVETYAQGSTVAPARRPGRLPPSAPRVPAQVPRGTSTLLTTESWAHPAWRAIGFAPHAHRTRTSFELVVHGSRFAVRALSDLDGDGTLETYERSGRLDARRRVQLDPPPPPAISR